MRQRHVYYSWTVLRPNRLGAGGEKPPSTAADYLNYPLNLPTGPPHRARLAKTIDYCKTFKPAQIDGTEDEDITIKLGANERKFTGQGLLQNFILPNFYFHCTTAYDILRHCGVELDKRDFMSTPVNL